MRIVFRVDGGFAVFPGLARPVDIDVDALPADVAKRLRDAVDACGFFDRPASSARTGPDLRCYEITVDDDGRSRSLSIPESDDDEALKTLIGLLEEQRRTARRG